VIRVVSKKDSVNFADLFKQMFTARSHVFHDRMKWSVVIKDGLEKDIHDEGQDATYVIVVDDDGDALGSLRLLPTAGQTMLKNEFSTFFDELVDIADPYTWECTRFCVHPLAANKGIASAQVSAELLIGLCDLCLRSGIARIVGLYDRSMTHIYRRIGWTPTPVFRSRPEFGNLEVGVWEATPAALQSMKVRWKRPISIDQRSVA